MPNANDESSVYISAEGSNTRPPEKGNLVPAEQSVGQLSAVGREEVDGLNWKTYSNEHYGFDIDYPASLRESSKQEVYFSLPLGPGAVRVFVDKKPSVLLTGTYGGSLPFEGAPDALVSTNRVLSEKELVGGFVFKKDYWVAYGGMGSWEAVINCYALYKGNWYMLSLQRAFTAGASRAVSAEGSEAMKREIRNAALYEMLNDENDYVKIFSHMLSSFRFFE